MLSNFIFNLQFLAQYLKRYNCFNFRFLNPKRGKQYLPDRPASSRPGRGAGRGSGRSGRPRAGPGRARRPGTCPRPPASGRPKPRPGRGHGAVTDGDVAGDQNPAATLNGDRRRKKKKGERDGARADATLTRKKTRSRSWMRGGTAAADSVKRSAAGAETERQNSSIRKLPSTPPSVRRGRGSGRSWLSASICGELGTPAAMEEHGLGRERERMGEQGRKMGAGGVRHGRHGRLGVKHSRGGGRHRAAWPRHGASGHGRPCGGREDLDFAQTSLALVSEITKRSRSRICNLIGALKQFYKI